VDVPSVNPASESTPAAKPRATAASKDAFASALKKAEDVTTPVKGHPFWKSLDGPHKGQYLNDSGNERDQQWFHRVKRDGRVFHTYEIDGKHVVVELKAKGAAGSGGSTAPTQ
jgi:hypothetical protein